MSNIKIIMVHGKTHSGKGIFSEILEKELSNNKNLNIIRCSLSTYIRNLVKEFYYEGDMDSSECRQFMAKVYEYGTILYPYHKARRMWENDIEPFLSTHRSNIIIVESFREKNDLEYFKILNNEGFKNDIVTLKIVRPNFEMKNYINANHKSENDLNDFEFMYEVLNDGTIDDLRLVAKKIVKELMRDV